MEPLAMVLIVLALAGMGKSGESSSQRGGGGKGSAVCGVIGPAGIYEAFKDLGVQFEGSFNSKGKAVCHAMDRPDLSASAFVNVRTGIYHAKGDVVETLNLFDFALKYGGPKYSDWLGTVKHFAESAGVELNARKDGKGRVLEAAYDYVDETGELVYQVIRYRLPSGKKDFRQRRPDLKGGWVYDLEGIRRVLYGLPAIIANPEHKVWIVEGEKDADRLNAHFQQTGEPSIATTSAQGANDTGRWESYADTLANRECFVIPDADVSGARHARGVATCLHGVASSVRIVELPGVGPKGDVSDWLDQDNTFEDLWAIVATVPPFDPSTAEVEQADADAERDATAADLINANAGTRWLWPQWLPLGVLTLLTAEPSTGKTRLGLDLTKRISLSMPWPDGQPMDLGDRRPVVLWIPADSQHSELADAPAAFGFPPEAIILNTCVGDLYGGTELQEEEQLVALEERINRIMPALVLIDTITNTSDAKSQDSSDAKRQYKPLQEIAKRTGTAIVCVTHTNLAGKTLGRRADEKTRVTIRLERPDENQPNRRKLAVALSRLSTYPPALGVTMGDAGNDYDFNPPEAPDQFGSQAGQPKMASPEIQRAMGWILNRLFFGDCRQSTMIDEAKNQAPPISKSSLYRAADQLIGQGKIESYENDMRRKMWRVLNNENGVAATNGTIVHEPEDDFDPDRPY